MPKMTGQLRTITPFGNGRRLVIAVAAAAGIALASDGGGAEEREHPLRVVVENAAAKVGEPTAVVAKITVDEGWRIAPSYRNRIIDLSSFDDGVKFEDEVVQGTVEEGSLVFGVGVTPTKPGAHAINGVFRVGYHNGEMMEMVSIPLIATVTGTK
jgi:hypothetical protein